MFSINFVFVCNGRVCYFRMSKVTLLFPVQISESISLDQSVIQFSFPFFHSFPESFVDFTVVLRCCRAIFLIFLRLFLLSHRSRMSFVSQILILFLDLPSTSDPVSMSAPCHGSWMFHVIVCFLSASYQWKFASSRCFKQVNYLQIFQLFQGWTWVLGRGSSSFFFNFSFTVAIISKSWSLLVFAPLTVLLLALLILDLNRHAVRI